MSANRFGCFVFVAMLASPAFAQLPIVTSSTLKLHLDATSGVATSGGLVTQWNDLSGNNNHFGQATVADRPALIGSGLNSLPTIRFTNDDLNVIGTGLNSNPARRAVPELNAIVGIVAKDVPLAWCAIEQPARIRRARGHREEREGFLSAQQIQH